MFHSVISTKDIVQIALFAAVTGALGLFPPVALPVLAVPITAQTMGMMLAGAILGARKGALSMLLVVALVAIGLPILAGGRGGLGVFFGPTAGFLLAWPVGAYVIGLLHQRARARMEPFTSFLYCFVGGILVVYAIGVPWAAANTGLSPWRTLVGALSFVPGDMFKAGLTALAVSAVRRAFPALGRTAA